MQQDAETLLALVTELVRELRPGFRESPTLDSAFDRELGLDSLARVELLARAERRFAVRFPESALEAATPRELLKAVFQSRGVSVEQIESSRREAAVERAEGSPDLADSLIAVLDWHVSRHPQREHVSFLHPDGATEALRYGDLQSSSGSIARALAREGVMPGQCVALMLPSGLDFFRCFYGILYAGAIPVPMYPPARPAQLEDHLRRQAAILRNCQAPLLITFEQVRPLARLLTGLAPEMKRIVTPDGLQGGPEHRGEAVPSCATALLQYTSGSTGVPKGVVLTHANLLANIRAWGTATGLTSSDVCVSWLPLYHDMGLIGTWLGSLYHACPLVLMSPLEFLLHPERWLRAIHQYGGTVTAAPNFAFDLCVKRLADQSLDGLDLSTWRLAANGAEPVSAESMERFARTFAPYGLKREALMPVYGLAECTVGLAVPPPGRGVRTDRVEREAFSGQGRAVPARGDDPHALCFVSCGGPLPGHAVRIVDDHGVELPERHVGHLEFRGPSATSGYYRNPAATAGLFDDGWLASGDLAYLVDGEIHIAGRSKDMIIRGGRNFYPYEAEEAIGNLPGVRKGCVAVFGVSDAEQPGERLVVVAECRERDPVVRDRLRKQIAERTADVLDLPPDAIVLAPPHAVLKTSSGKIRRAAVRDAYLEGTLGAGDRAPWRQAVALLRSGLHGHVRNALVALKNWSYGAWVWSCFGVLAAAAVVFILVLPRLEQRWACSRALARLLARLARCELSVSGLEHLPTDACVLVSNHASYIDAFVLAAALPHPVRFVAKAEFRRNRWLSGLFARLEVRFVERTDMLKGVDDAATLGEEATRGRPLLFFAEGTFGPREELLPFRLGAFQVAARNALTVVPVVLAGTRGILRDGSWLPRRGPVSVTVLPAVASAGQDWRAVVGLRDAVRLSIQGALSGALGDERA